MGDVVVTALDSGPPRTSRSLRERIYVRFPSLYRRPAPLVSRLSPRSRLRRALVRQAVLSGWHAASRRDFELVMVRYAEDVEFEFDPEFEALGLTGPFRGREGILARDQTFQEEWQRWEAVPATVLDLGDRSVVLGTLRLTGKVSEVELEREVAQLIAVRRGLVVHDRVFLGWEKGLRAAGLDPDDIELPSRATG